MKYCLKTVSQLSASLFALGALLAGAASHATDIQELPLRASVLAKPNVIWGIDDSGSMDSEVMLGTNDGAFWWDHNNASGWSEAGVLHFNAVGTASAQWRKMVYLFPNGSGTGERTYADADNDHFAILPTRQFAFLRSSKFNPLYFNPQISYMPWAPGYVAGAKKTFGNAATSAAPSHPLQGNTSFDLAVARAQTTAANQTFMALPGMVIPAGSKTCVHPACGSWTDEAVERTVPAGTVLRVAMAYFPATYYKAEDCGAIDGTSCVSAPDGTKLRRVEIKSGNYATAAAYQAELQNFANWFTYYRKRKLMTNAAMGQVLEPITGLRMGLVRFNNRAAVTMYDTDSTDQSMNRLKITGLFYETNGSGGTPTRETLKYIGDQYLNNAATIQYACQRNNAFIVTDGFAVATVTNPPGYDASKWGSGVPYQTTYGGTLADIALSYYTNNLRPAMAAGRVPTNASDLNQDLHMNTYGLTLGAKGTIWQNESTPAPVAAGTWPNPVDSRSPTSIDDLWHATINGRGKMYGGSDITSTAASIQAGLLDILNAQGSQTGVAVSTVNLVRGDTLAYLASYNPSGWRGDVTANAIDQSTAVIAATPTWSASTLLDARAWGTRVIASQTAAGTGVAFTEAGVGAVVNPGGVYGVTAEVMNYLRGERTHEGTKFRKRTSLMGAIINSEPAISRTDKVLYIASGEGLLHAFDLTPGADAGKELWAFVPRAVLPDIGATVDRAYSFKTQLDGSPALGAITGKRILVAGMGVAGRSYYALDVSSPRGLTDTTLATKVMWEFPAAGDAATQAKVGQTMGRPVITKRPNGTDVVLVTSGYNNNDNVGRVWMLNANTGAVIHEYALPAGASDAGLAHVAAFDEGNGTSKYAYGGDLQGNLWRFNLETPASPDKVAVLTNPAGATQPVTVPPELTMIDTHRIIVVPTGRLLHINDGGSSGVQTLYVIKDGALLNPARNSLVQQTYTRASDTLTGNAVNWNTDRGWYMDLPAGEQGNTRPTITDEGVSFVTNVNGGTDCSASSYLYLVNVKTGKKLEGASFIGSTLSTSSNATAATALITRTGNIAFVPRCFSCPTPIPPRYAPRGGAAPGKGAWREVRRTP